MTWKDIGSLTVLGSIIVVLGNIVAIYLKDVFAVRSLEKWRTRQSLDSIFDRYRRPICLAAEELSGRCYILAENSEPWRKNFKYQDVKDVTNDHNFDASTSDSYFRYRILSDAYRLCCFLGWIELYRRELGLINVQNRKLGKMIEDCIKDIRSTLADGQLNFHFDWEKWKDYLIFREEQRAIAHRMIAQIPSLGLIDYGTFCESLTVGSSGRWFTSSVLFFVEINSDHDFRMTRMKLLVVHLTTLRELLQPGSVLPKHLEGSRRLKRELDAERKKIEDLRINSTLRQ